MKHSFKANSKKNQTGYEAINILTYSLGSIEKIYLNYQTISISRTKDIKWERCGNLLISLLNLFDKSLSKL